jgi:hypothetical protein
MANDLTDVIDGYNTTVEYGDAATVAGSTSWTEVTEVDEITLPPITVEDVEQRPHKATNQGATRRAGWRIPGDGSISILQTADQAAALLALLGTTRGWRFTDEDGNILSGAAYIADVTPGVTKEGDNTWEFRLAAAEVWTYTTA